MGPDSSPVPVTEDGSVFRQSDIVIPRISGTPSHEDIAAGPAWTSSTGSVGPPTGTSPLSRAIAQKFSSAADNIVAW